MDPNHIPAPNAPPHGTLHFVFGPQGSGKSTHGHALAARTNGVCFSIDPWMLELYGPDMPHPLDLAWIMQRVRRCETRILKTALPIVRQGMDAVLDVGGMTAAERNRLLGLADLAAVPVQRHYLSADPLTRRQRVMARNADRGETFAFDVTPFMFDTMESRYQAPDARELAGAHTLET